MIAIAKSVILKNIRNPKYLIFNAIFPIFLMAILGGLLGGVNNNNNTLTNKTVYYINNGNSSVSSILNEAEKIKNTEFIFKKIDNKNEGITKAENGDLFLDLNKNNIEIYANSSNSMYYVYLKSMFTGINKSNKVYELVYKNDYKNAKEILKSNNAVNVKLLSKKAAPSGMDYYAVVELSMMVLYIMLFPTSGYDKDRKTRVKERILLSGTSLREYIFGSTLGYFLTSFIITLPGFLFSIFVLKANWGSNPIMYYAVLEIFALLIILIGTIISTIFTDLDKVMTIIQAVLIPVFAFLGGSYMSLPYNSKGLGFFGYITYISPLRWLNKGILLSIYDGKNEMLYGTTIGFIVLIIICILILSLLSKREEGRI